MYQYDDPTCAASLPTPAAAGTAGYFTDGNPAGGVAATELRSDFMNMLMMELLNIVRAAGETPSKTSYNQVLTAIQALFASVSGNASKTFAVATATAANQAVPLAQMNASLGGYAGVVSPANGATLDITMLGQFILLGGSFSFTLAALSTFGLGDALICSNTSSAQGPIVSVTGSDEINLGSSTNVTSFVVQPGQTVAFVKESAAAWRPVGVSVNAVLPLVVAAATGATHAVQMSQMALALGGFSGAVSLTNGQTVTSAFCGELLHVGSGNTYDLDAIANFTTGESLNFINNANAGNATIVQNGTDLVVVGATQVSSFAIPPGQLARFTKISSTTWRVDGMPTANLFPLPVAAATAPTHAMQLGQATGRLLNVQKIGASTTYTPTAGTTSIVVEIVGGGGGGGGCAATSSSQVAVSGGGGGGGYAKTRITSSFAGTLITVGTPGAAGSAGNNPGGSGGTTSFGSFCSAIGGIGGLGGAASANTVSSLSNGGGPGSSTGGSIINTIGSWGGNGIQIGASITLGGGGSSGVGKSGGDGLQLGSSQPATAGNPGISGLVIIWEYA